MKKTFLLTVLLGLWGVFSSAEALNTADVVMLDSSTTSHDFEAEQSSIYTIALPDLAEFKKLASSSTSNAMLIAYGKTSDSAHIGIGIGIGRGGNKDNDYPLRFYNFTISGFPGQVRVAATICITLPAPPMAPTDVRWPGWTSITSQGQRLPWG